MRNGEAEIERDVSAHERLNHGLPGPDEQDAILVG